MAESVVQIRKVRLALICPASLLASGRAHCVWYRFPLFSFAELLPLGISYIAPFSVFYSAFILFPFSTLPTYSPICIKDAFLSMCRTMHVFLWCTNAMSFAWRLLGSCALNSPLEPTGGGPSVFNLLDWPGRVPVMWEASKGKLLIPWMLSMSSYSMWRKNWAWDGIYIPV